MKNRLIILSELHGFKAEKYQQILENHFEIKFYDSRELAKIDKKKSKEKNHQDFVNFGIEKAVENLLKKEKNQINILAFSVGGVIAWKFALKTKNVKCLTAISSTRLRYEVKKPSAKINLYFGEKDNYKPDLKWFEELKLENKTYKNFGHELYEDKIIAEKISQEILQEEFLR